MKSIISKLACLKITNSKKIIKSSTRLINKRARQLLYKFRLMALFKSYRMKLRGRKYRKVKKKKLHTLIALRRKKYKRRKPLFILLKEKKRKRYRRKLKPFKILAFTRKLKRLKKRKVKKSKKVSSLRSSNKTKFKRLRRKKVLVIRISQSFNNMFSNVTLGSYKSELYFKQMKQALIRLRIRKVLLEKIYTHRYTEKYLSKRKELSNIFPKCNVKFQSRRFYKFMTKAWGIAATWRYTFEDLQNARKLVFRNKEHKALWEAYFSKKLLKGKPKKFKTSPITERFFLQLAKKKFFEPYRDETFEETFEELYNRKVLMQKIKAEYKKKHTYLYNYRHFTTKTDKLFWKTLKEKKLLFKWSCGSLETPGPLRQTIFAIEIMGNKVGQFVKQPQFSKYLKVVILKTPISRNIRGFFRGLYLSRPKIHMVYPNFPFAHGSIRRRKARRV